MRQEILPLGFTGDGGGLVAAIVTGGLTPGDHSRSKRSAFITLVQAAKKWLTNFS
jgi:hypothetical protein